MAGMMCMAPHEYRQLALAYLLLDDDANGANISQRSENISRMELVAGLENADSLAYTCIAATFMEMGYSIDNDGDVKKGKTKGET